MTEDGFKLVTLAAFTIMMVASISIVVSYGWIVVFLLIIVILSTMMFTFAGVVSYANYRTMKEEEESKKENK